MDERQERGGSLSAAEAREILQRIAAGSESRWRLLPWIVGLLLIVIGLPLNLVFGDGHGFVALRAPAQRAVVFGLLGSVIAWGVVSCMGWRRQVAALAFALPRVVGAARAVLAREKAGQRRGDELFTRKQASSIVWQYRVTRSSVAWVWLEFVLCAALVMLAVLVLLPGSFGAAVAAWCWMGLPRFLGPLGGAVLGGAWGQLRLRRVCAALVALPWDERGPVCSVEPVSKENVT